MGRQPLLWAFLIIVAFGFFSPEAFAQGTSRRGETYLDSQDDDLGYLPGPTDNPWSAGVGLDFVMRAKDEDQGLEYEAGPRINFIVANQVQPTVNLSGSLGIRSADLTDTVSGIVVGELTQMPLTGTLTYTPTHPFIGTGRTDKEFRLTPFSSLGLAYILYFYDAQRDDIVTYRAGDSFGVTFRIGLEMQMPETFSFTTSFGYDWSTPGSLNLGAFVLGFGADIRF